MDNELVVKIESITNLGAGIAKHDGKIIFIPNTCPEDVVKIKLTKQAKNYSNGELLEIITPSPHRIKPICPMQKVCGACHFQFINYKYQLKIKQQIVKDCMRGVTDNNGNNIEVLETIPSPVQKEYRHKIQYPISETQNSKRILAGYYKQKTHEIVNIKYCPTQPRICDEIIDFIRENAQKHKISGYQEKQHSGILRHVVIRNSNFNNENLVILVINADKISENIKNFAHEIYNKFNNVTGVSINFNNRKTNLILGKSTECICGKSYIEEKLCDKVFYIEPNTFFQVNPQSAENIFNYIKTYIKDHFNNPTILDAYAGIAAFGVVMSDISKNIVSVEENPECIKIAKSVLEKNNITNIELHAEDTAKYLDKAISNKQNFDISIIDPPRKGCSEESLDKVLAVTNKKIIYVSCNPQTLARDLKYLIKKGATVTQVKPFDMFCHTYHIESVAIIDINP